MTARKDDAHPTELTPMQKGGCRAECACGWWQDHPTDKLAARAALLHRRHAGYDAARAARKVTLWQTSG